MKRFAFLLALTGLVALSGAALGDSLLVNNTAAMGGSGTACSGSNCGLEVLHDNTSAAFVQDNTPNNETIYRSEFLFNPNDISPGANLRQVIFLALDNNPNPGQGICGNVTFVSNFRCFLSLTGGAGQNYSVQCYARGGQCGEVAVSRLPISANQPTKICVEYEINDGSLGGRIAVAPVSPHTDPCPTSGSGAWSERAVTNRRFSGVDIIRMGTPGTNSFGAGENGSMYFDEFQSFRTLSP